MKKIAIGIGVAIALVVGAVLVAPSFVDWTRYRDPIAERISALTGRNVQIKGAVAFRMLPEPRLEVRGVSIANLPGAPADMVQMKSLTVRVALLPLLGGRIAVQSVALIKPIVRLDVLGDGRENWIMRPKSPDIGRPGPTGEVIGFRAVRLDSVRVQDGTIIYSGGPGKAPIRFEKIDAEFRARTLAGPYDLRGTMRSSGEPLAFQLTLGPWTPDHQAPLLAHVDLVKSDAHLTADGVIFGALGTERFNGAVKAEGKNFARVIKRLAGISAPRLDLPFKLDFQATGDRARVAVNDIGFQFGGNAVSGAATVAFLPRGPHIDAKLAVGYLNLDSFLKRTGSVRAVEPKTSAPAATTVAASAWGAAFANHIPTSFSGSLDLRISVASFHGGIVRDMRVAGSLQNGQLTIRHLGALLPGASTVSLTGTAVSAPAGPQFSGQLTVASADVRALLSWLGVNSGRVPPGRLTILSANIPFTATPNSLTSSQIDVHFDQSHVTGSATLKLDSPPALALDLAVDRVDLDDYLPAAFGQPLQPVAGMGTDVTSRPAKEPPLMDLSASFAWVASVDTELKLQVGELVYRVVPVRGVTLDLALHNGQLNLNNFQIANAGGASVVISGSATDLLGNPRYQGTLALQAPGIGIFARLGGLAPPPSWMTLRGLKVAAKASGDMTGLKVSGLDVGLGPDEATGDIELRFTRPRPQIRANLAVTSLQLDPFLGGKAGLGAARGISAAGEQAGTPSAAGGAKKSPWSGHPFDLSPIDWVDGVAALSAKQITMKGYQVRNAEITATFNDGAVTLNPIRGLIFGGALAAKAQLSGGTTASVGASFVWQDADLHRIVFGLTGLRALSGQATIRGNLQSQGASPDALIRHLGGKVIVHVERGEIQGLDVARLSRGLKRLKSGPELIALSNVATSSGATQITRLQGTWTVAQGIARTADTRVTFPNAVATVNGSLDLPSWSMGLRSALRLMEYAEAPPLGIELSGAIDAPRRRLDTAALEDYVAAAAVRPSEKEGAVTEGDHGSAVNPSGPKKAQAASATVAADKTPAPKTRTAKPASHGAGSALRPTRAAPANKAKPEPKP